MSGFKLLPRWQNYTPLFPAQYQEAFLNSLTEFYKGHAKTGSGKTFNYADPGVSGRRYFGGDIRLRTVFKNELRKTEGKLAD